MSKVLILAILLVPASYAHHSIAQEYDEKKPVNIKGVVTAVAWENPHVFLDMRITNANGSVTDWHLETGGPNVLARFGWTKETLRVGDVVTASGYLGRRDPHHGLVTKLSKPGMPPKTGTISVN